MACKIDIKNTINKSIENKVDFDFWGYSLSQAKNLTKFINDIWNTNILSYLQRDGRGSYQILKDESKIDEAVEIEYNKQLKAETKIAEIDREINERDLGIDEFGDSNPSYERVDYKNVSYQNSQFKPDNKAKTIEQSNTLFGLNTQNQEQLEFHLNTLNAVSQFLENAGIETRLISEFLSQDGNVVEGAIAAANFIEGTVDIIDDLEKGRAEAWNKLPEEAAHWWYRLLDKNSELKDALLTSALTDRKEEELRNSLYGETYKDGPKVIGKLALDSNGNVTSKPALSAIREEAIGQLIAEAIKRIETKNAAPEDYSFFKKFLEWINSIIDIFKTTNQDPFEVAAMKILSSDMSDLMTWEEYRKVNNIVNFADVLTEQSVAPVDYTLIEDIGFIGSTFMEDNYGNATSGYRFHFKDSNWVQKYGNSSPSFYTQQELDNWVSVNIKEHDIRQKQQIQEVRDNQIFFDRLLNKTFRKKSKFLPKTLRKYYDIIDAQNLNQLREWNISQELQQITKKLSEQEKKQIIETNGYTNIAPTLKVLPDLLKKYGRKTTPEIIKQEIEITNKLVKNEITKEQATELRQKLENKKKGNSIVLSEPIKIDGAKKQELSILNGIKEMIKLENPNLKSITAEEFVAEAHNWLKTNYLLGFANENSYLSYRTDQTFKYLSDRQTNEDVDITNLTEEEIQRLPFEERQRIANIVGLTKQNPDVYHNKVSLRFNDMYHLKSGHFQKSPSAWGNLTYFYTGKNKWKDAVLLHEIQNDNIEALREFKAEKVDLETSLGRYLQQLNTDLLDNITQIESGGKKIQKKFDINPKRTHIQLNYQLEQIKDLPLEQGLQQLKQRLNELIELFKSDFSKDINKAKENVDEAYSKRRIFQDFQKRGGIKSLLTKEELQDLEDLLKRLNTEEVVGEAQWLPEENQFEPGFPSIRDLIQKKKDFSNDVIAIQTKINDKLSDTYGDNAPVITLQAPAKPLPKSQRNMRTVGYGQNQRRVGGASQELNENVNFLIAYSEKQISTQLSKNIEDSKRNYIFARNATVANNFNVALSKITNEQYATLIENYKYNEDLLNRLIDEQAQKDIKQSSDLQAQKENDLKTISQINSDRKDTPGIKNWFYQINGNTFKTVTKQEAIEDIETYYDKDKKVVKQNKEFETLKQKALDKKAELEKNYGKIEEEVKQTLEIEMNYFTPLVHHLIQKHINQYGKDFPMYFSGYQITKLTQGNDRTALIYAGKDEINIVNKNSFRFNNLAYDIRNSDGAFLKSDYSNQWEGEIKTEVINQQEYEKAYQQATERRAKEIKFEAAQQIGIIPLVSYGESVSLEEGIKKLNEYKKQSKQNMDRVINTIMNVSDSKPIETGAIYNAMSQISGIKLIWQDKIDGLKGNTGGYLVDLTNYNYNVPILYGLQNNKPRDLTSIQFQKLTAEEKARTIEQITKLKSSIQIFDKNSNNKNFDSSNLKDDDLALMLFNQALGLNLTSINQLTWENIKDNIFFEKEDGSLGVKNLAFTSGNLLSTKKATLSDFLNQKGLFPEYKVFIGESVIYPNVFETLQTENDAIKKAVFENLFNLSGAFEQVKKELNNHSSETFIIETPDGKFTFSKRFAAGFWNIASKVELLLKENQSSYIQDYLASKKEKEEVTRDGKKVKPEITKTLTVNDTIVQNAIGLIGNPIIENAIKNNTSVKIQVFSNAEYSEDGIAGWFLPASNTIYLHESMLKPQHLSEGLPLIAHELIHSVTEQSLQFDKNFQREIQSLLDRVKSQSEIKDFYGFKNTSEFLSEAFSSQEFRQLLKDTQFSNTENLSVWQKFVNAILKLFGKNTKYSEKTIVTNAEQILNSIINQHSYKIGFVNSKISDKIYSNTKIDYSKLTAEEKAKTIEQVTKEQNNSLFGLNTNKPDVILPIGTSGSGKSTFIKSLPQENLVIIEPDAMRVEFTGDINNKSKDKEIYIESANRAIKAIKQGKQVVFDTTNLTKEKRRPFIEAIRKEFPNANIQYKLMELNPELAKQRIKNRLKTNPPVEKFDGFWNRSQVANQTNKVFLFGDNTNDRTVTNYVPSMTQAVIRGLPNAIGIDTKKDRGTSINSYLTDNDLEWFKGHVDTQIQKAKDSGKTIVVPADGIGTGKAMLKEKAPKLFKYLQEKLRELELTQGANVSDATIDRHAESYKQMLEDIKDEGITNYDDNQQFQNLTDKEESEYYSEYNKNDENSNNLQSTESILETNPKLKKFIEDITDEDGSISLFKYNKIINDKEKFGNLPVMKTITKLNNILKNAVNRLWDNRINAENNLKIKFVESLEDEDAVAQFLRKENEIHISKNIFLNILDKDFKDYPEFYTGYLLNHELIHYLTPQSLSIKPQFIDRLLLNEKSDMYLKNLYEREFVKNIKNLYNFSISQLEDLSDYGFTNLAEFVTEAMSNPGFQVKLSTIKYKNENKSLWKKFIKILSDYLSSITGNSIEDTVLEAVISEVTNYITENSNIERTYKTKINNSGDTQFYFVFNKNSEIGIEQEEINNYDNSDNENFEFNEDLTGNEYIENIDNKYLIKFEELLNKGVITQICN